MELIVRAFNVLPGQEEELLELGREMKRRASEVGSFYGRYGVSHESWHLQRTEGGAMVIAITQFEARDVAAAANAYQHSSDDFESWFHGKVRQICGIDPREQPLGPLTDCIFRWDGEGG
jgi:hypothetical protein